MTRITAALMLGFIRLYYGPRYDLSLLGIFSAWGVTRKFFGLLLAYRWGSLVRVGISLVLLGLIGTCWLLAETAIKPIIVG